MSLGWIVWKPAPSRDCVTASKVPLGEAAAAASWAVVCGIRTIEMSMYWGPQFVPMSKRMARP